MTDKELVRLLTDQENINDISESVLDELDDVTRTGQAVILAIALINGYREDKIDEIDYTTSGLFPEISLKAFYLGVDWTLKQLGNPGIMEQLPESLHPDNTEPFYDIEE